MKGGGGARGAGVHKSRLGKYPSSVTSCIAPFNLDIDLLQGFEPSENSKCAGQSICILNTLHLEMDLVYKNIKDCFWPSVITWG